MKSRRVGHLVVLTAFIGVSVTGAIAWAVSSSASPSPGSPTIMTSPESALTPVQVGSIALSEATSFGEPSPANVLYVESTRKIAELLISKDKVSTDQPVFVVEATGEFTGYDLPVPSDQPVPNGTVLIVTIDAVTGNVSDITLGNSSTDLSALGLVKSLNS